MINAVCEKLIARHPHIYGDVEVNDEEDEARNRTVATNSK